MTDALYYRDNSISSGFESYISREHIKVTFRMHDLINNHAYSSELDGFQKLSDILVPFSRLNNNYKRLSINNDFSKAMLNLPWFRALVTFHELLYEAILSTSPNENNSDTAPFKIVKNPLTHKQFYRYIIQSNIKRKRKYSKFLNEMNFSNEEISAMLLQYDEQMDSLLDRVLAIMGEF